MALVEQKNIDVSSTFKEPKGTVFLTNIITLEDLKAALIVDKKHKSMYLYQYEEGEISFTLSPIEDNEIREALEHLVRAEMKRQQGEA